jgi:hypothetical protein
MPSHVSSFPDDVSDRVSDGNADASPSEKIPSSENIPYRNITVMASSLPHQPSVNDPTAEQRAACRSMGTKRCAPICRSNPPTFDAGACPEAHRVWTPVSIIRERKRRPDGPLAAVGVGRVRPYAKTLGCIALLVVVWSFVA